jgi:hypothetical protein
MRQLLVLSVTLSDLDSRSGTRRERLPAYLRLINIICFSPVSQAQTSFSAALSSPPSITIAPIDYPSCLGPRVWQGFLGSSSTMLSLFSGSFNHQNSRSIVYVLTTHDHSAIPAIQLLFSPKSVANIFPAAYAGPTAAVTSPMELYLAYQNAGGLFAVGAILFLVMQFSSDLGACRTVIFGICLYDIFHWMSLASVMEWEGLLTGKAWQGEDIGGFIIGTAVFSVLKVAYLVGLLGKDRPAMVKTKQA